LGKGADVNIQGGEYGNALQAASYEGHHEIVKLLLDNGAVVNAQGGKYGNALQAASYEGHHEIVKLLLGKVADSCYKSDEDLTIVNDEVVRWRKDEVKKRMTHH
jgi:ankyrin repeat protein